ncbi:LytTR family DNA-binding domain-containing protein [Blastomonas sp. SL216]|uniref:LytTR family DNA-binding domain-containing protein n=1 Tax=Blastomonas sp. SL216 TaxID=2995169 RepID=UPI0023771D41|nr:LytTR family DNA-binding domain-containing protein [Blastomonas sp. SL216]
MKTQAVRGLVIGLAAAVVLAYLGALGTQDAPFVQRLAYWGAVILPGSLLGLAITTLVRSWGGLLRHRWLEAGLVALLISIPHSFVVIVVSALFFGIGMITPMVVLQFWLAVLMIALVLAAINYLASTDQAQDSMPMATAAPAGPESGPPLPAPAAPSAAACDAIPALLAEKLPHRLRAGRLLAIEAEDHYLRVHTDLGSDLVLMRMADACALLEGSNGARVHRSWWIARSAIRTVRQQSGRMELDLADGLVAPVSRAMQPVLRREGWL